MSNSNLVNYTRLSPNCNKPRNQPIRKITIHHMAGNLTVERCGALFANWLRRASSNYGIGTDGRVGLYVDEANRSWCSSSGANDHQAVTIEVANDSGAPNWTVSDAAYNKLIELCVDICQRNGIKELTWTGDATGTLTCHYMFSATACPGPYLKARMFAIAAEVNRRLGAPAAEAKTVDQVAREVLQGKWGNGADRKARLEAAGYDYAAVQSAVNVLLGKPATVAPAGKTVDQLAREVLQGKWGNGLTRKARLKAAGYDYAAVQARVNQLAK